MLDGDVTDVVEARSLSFRPHYIDIYLCTWGPKDDGITLEGPGPLTRRALQNGIERVRETLVTCEKKSVNIFLDCLFCCLQKAPVIING